MDYNTIVSSHNMNNDIFCNNCGKVGHHFYQCKIPITSFGVIAFRLNPNTNKYEFLMIRRRDTLGYIDFLRGKYTLHSSHYIINMFKQMTIDEKTKICENEFHVLWKELWGNDKISNQYKIEETVSKEKFNALKNGVIMNDKTYTLSKLIEESNYNEMHENMQWSEPEWGFPKGRRNNLEKDYDCALREFSEETGYDSDCLKNINNILPFEEIFTGSNYKSYKHKYYLMYMTFIDSLVKVTFENTEVSDISWKTIEECISCIRPYNLEKIRMIQKIHTFLLHSEFYI